MNPDAARYHVYKNHIYSSGRRESDGKSALNDLCDDPVYLESRIYPVYIIVFSLQRGVWTFESLGEQSGRKWSPKNLKHAVHLARLATLN